MLRDVTRWWIRLLRRENLHRLLLVLLALSLLGAVGLWLFEEQSRPFTDWLWWSIVTLTTVGYGDIAPVSLAGRAIGVVLMLFGIGVLSTFTASIASLLVEQRLQRERGMHSFHFEDHILICGWNSRAPRLLEQLRSDPRCHDRPVVVLAELDSKPVDDDQLYLVHGQVTEENLERANLTEATTVLILGDRNVDPTTRDAKAVLAALTVETLHSDAYTIVELAHEANVRHCELAQVDEIIVSDEFGSRLMASAALDHGLSKVISELLSSDLGQDLRQMPVPASLVGRPFLEVLQELKQNHGCTAVAVSDASGEVETNPPPGRTIEQDDILVVITPSENAAANLVKSGVNP